MLAGQMVGQLLEYWFERASAEGPRWVEAALAHLDAAAHPAVVARLLLTSSSLSNANSSLEAAEPAIAFLDTVGDSWTLARAHFRLANGLYMTRRFNEAATALDRVMRLYEDAGLARTRRFAAALTVRAMVHLGQQRLSDARTSGTAGLALSESLGDEDEIARAKIYLAEVEFNSGDARRALELVLQVKGSPGLTTPLEAAALANSAAYLLALGDTAGARTAARAALLLLRLAHMHWMAPNAILHLAAALAVQGNARRAARLLGFTDAWTSRQGCE